MPDTVVKKNDQKRQDTCHLFSLLTYGMIFFLINAINILENKA